MQEQLAKMVEANGMASVLAALRNMMARDADELREMGNASDDATADTLDAIASDLLRVAQDYAKLQEA